MTKVKVKNEEVYRMSDCMLSFMNACETMSGKLHYAVDRNLKKLEPLIMVLQERRKDIVEADCDRDDKGNPVLKENKEGQREYQWADEKLKEKAEKAIKDLLSKDAEVEVYKIPLSLYNECTIDPKKLLYHNILFDIYIEENM